MTSPATVLLHKVNANILRRKEILENDALNHKIIQNRVVSNELAQICGMQKWLERSNNAKQLYASKEVVDEWSHTTIKRGDLLNKYTKKTLHTT
jgi:hypothetical protein